MLPINLSPIFRVSANDSQRADALRSYDILDSLREDEFDRITEMASIICNTPVCLVSMIDENRQWIKSAHGLNVKEFPREDGMCQYTIMESGLLEVKDTLKDNRFKIDPAIMENFNVRFYAGCPLIDPDGFALGALCVIDYTPRVLTSGQKRALTLLTEQVMDLITERRAKLELRNFEKIFEFSNDLMFVGNQNGHFIKINPSFSRVFGWSTDHLLKTPHFEFLHPGDLESTINQLDKLAAGQPTTNFIQRFLCSSGEYKYIQWTSSPELSTGKIYGIGRDITEKQKIQEALDRTNVLLEQTSRVARVGGWSLDVKTKKVSWTEITKEIHGVNPDFEPELDTAVYFYKEGESRKAITKALELAINEGKSWDVQLQIINLQGQPLWVRALGNAEFENGICTRLFGTIQDIDEYKIADLALKNAFQTQENLNNTLTSANAELSAAQDDLRRLVRQVAESEQQFRSFIEQAPVAISVFDSRKLIVSVVNDKILEIWGRTSDVLGKPLEQVIPELKGQPFLKILDDVFMTGIPYYGNENRAIIRRNDELTEGYFNLIYQPIRDKNGVITGILNVVNEVTDQVNARIKIELAEESLRMAVDAANMGTYAIHTHSLTLYASPRLKELLGYDHNEHISLKTCFDQISKNYRLETLKKFKAAIRHKGRLEIEFPVLTHNQKKLHWLKLTGNLQHNNKPDNKIFTGVAVDVTEQRLDEQRKDDFISIVSHELKTPLTSLGGYLQILSNKAQKSEDDLTKVMLDKTIIQVKKMTTMVNGFLNVSRLESGKIHIDKQRFNILNLLNDILVEASNTILTHNILLEPSGPLYIIADRDKIEQVISNLISNAVKYSPAKSSILVSCLAHHGQLFLSIKDYGMGVSPKDAERLFDRYYRVEGKQMHNISGFGIGLYLCAEIIKRHSGKIWVDSILGEGSTFSFCLPLTA